MFDFVYLSSIRRADDVERPRFLMEWDLTRVKIHGIIIWIRRCYITTIEHPASAASPVQIFFIRSLICVRSLYRKAAITSQYETRNANVIPPPLSLIKNYFLKKKDEAIYWWYITSLYIRVLISRALQCRCSYPYIYITRSRKVLLLAERCAA